MKKIILIITFMMLSLACGISIKAQSISMKSLTNALYATTHNDMRSWSPLVEALERAGYHSVKTDEVRSNYYYVNLYSKSCKVKRKKKADKNDQTSYEAVQPNKNASIIEIICFGDGTFVGLRLITYGKANAESWKKQLEKDNFSCSSSGRSWKFKKQGYPTITIWDNRDQAGAYVLIAK